MPKPDAELIRECKRCGLRKSTVEATGRGCIKDKQGLEQHDFGDDINVATTPESWKQRIREILKGNTISASTKSELIAYVEEALSEQRKVIEEVAEKWVSHGEPQSEYYEEFLKEVSEKLNGNN